MGGTVHPAKFKGENLRRLFHPVQRLGPQQRREEEALAIRAPDVVQEFLERKNVMPLKSGNNTFSIEIMHSIFFFVGEEIPLCTMHIAQQERACRDSRRKPDDRFRKSEVSRSISFNEQTAHGLLQDWILSCRSKWGAIQSTLPRAALRDLELQNILRTMHVVQQVHDECVIGGCVLVSATIHPSPSTASIHPRACSFVLLWLVAIEAKTKEERGRISFSAKTGLIHYSLKRLPPPPFLASRFNRGDGGGAAGGVRALHGENGSARESWCSPFK